MTVDTNLRKTMLKLVADIKKEGKKKFGLSAEHVRAVLRDLAKGTLDALAAGEAATREKAMELMQQAGVYDKSEKLTPEFGGEQPKKKAKKKRRA